MLSVDSSEDSLETARSGLRDSTISFRLFQHTATVVSRGAVITVVKLACSNNFEQVAIVYTLSD